MISRITNIENKYMNINLFVTLSRQNYSTDFHETLKLIFLEI